MSKCVIVFVFFQCIISSGNFWIYTAQSPIISRSRDRQYLPTVSLLLSCTPTYEQCKNTRLGGDPIGVLVFAETSLCDWMELRRSAKKATTIEQQIWNFLNSYFLVLSVREAFCWKMHGTVLLKIIAPCCKLNLLPKFYKLSSDCSKQTKEVSGKFNTKFYF